MSITATGPAGEEAARAGGRRAAPGRDIARDYARKAKPPGPKTRTRGAG